MNTWKRRLLALLSVPLLAVPSAVGVYSYLAPESGWLAAGLAAAGFEVLYIGVNVLVVHSVDLRRYARNVSLAAVAVAVLMNSLAHYGHKVSGAYTGAKLDVLAVALALIASAPLAGLAYATSVLLHRLSEADVRTCAEDVRSRAALAQRDEEIARLTAQLAQSCADADTARETAAREQTRLAQEAREFAQRAHDLERQSAHQRAELAERDSEIVRLRDQLAQTPQNGSLDRAALARALREPRAASWRECEELLGVAQSTLRGQLEARTRRNGHAVEAQDEQS